MVLSHPITFLVGYLVVTFILAFAVLGPLMTFILMLFRRRMERRFSQGLFLGASATAWAFMMLHYLLYLRGYGITDFSRLFHDIFYPPRYF